MSLRTQLTEDMKQSMRDRNMIKLNSIRFLLSELKNFEIDNGEQDDAGIQKIIAKTVKQMEESVAEYQKAGREELVAEEQQKIDALKGYLPQQLSDEELASIVKSVMAEMPNPNMGQVISAVKAKVGGQADGGRIASLVKQHLQ